MVERSGVKEDADAKEPVRAPSFWGRVKAVGPFAFLLTILGTGFTVATMMWSSSNTNLQTDLRRDRKSVV
jgi:hypothetical protein